ncbi:unnamed protein product [Polarella glacialis]|uniref:Lactation elevated protein 1 n=1 Tax=Polarella glacialis TaxID=89957 RepID=A0A813G1B6_POLGL|nr:unnamed protein product [Polarella glacialis]
MSSRAVSGAICAARRGYALEPQGRKLTGCRSQRSTFWSTPSPCSSSSSSSVAFSAAPTLKFEFSAEAASSARGQGPLALFSRLVELGQLQDDSEQRRVLEYLNAVFFGASKRTARGLYLYGSVGCGKTMSMDLFYSAVKDLSGLRVVRKHFHDFLHDVQLDLHRLKRDKDCPSHALHPVERVGARIADSTDVLCFDEFAITTIQDCVLLMPLFSALFRRGVTVVATSNRAPEDLYSDGLNRHVYMPPFLDTLAQYCKVLELKSSTDYRMVHYENSADAGVFCWPPSRSFVDKWFEATGGQGVLGARVDIAYGRSLDVPQLSSCGRVARFSFEDLCRKELSADDYLTISRQFHTILLDDVPCLSVDEHNEARRFTTLIDSCYEHHVKLICSMACPPDELLAGLVGLRDLSLAAVGKGVAGCGDGDSSSSSSGVLQAISRIKTSLADRKASPLMRSEASAAEATMDSDFALEVLSGEVQRVREHGTQDMQIWSQGGEASKGRAPPQVSKSWDDRRRISAFTWESQDPTSEQQSIKGVFAAAVASLKESGFAVERAISRLREMQTETFQENHKLKHLCK